MNQGDGTADEGRDGPAGKAVERDGARSGAFSRPVPVAVLISGRGSNMMSLVEAANRTDFPARITGVISNRPDAAGLAWAKERGLETAVVDHKAFDDRAGFDAALDMAIRATGAELVALSGFMRLLTPDFVRLWHNRMINIHPALLPSFKGLDTHARAIKAGVKFAGCTVHLVRPEMDEGPILGQAAVPVRPDDTPDSLAARVLIAEHKLYPQVLGLFASDQICVEGDSVVSRNGGIPEEILFSPLV